ncbi:MULTISPECIES: DUF2586 family protein [Butyricimonas]|uniref:DUF2586 family protein n=1 Tax=Butyricimonas TaxID=574697 RepID=UPI001D081BF3|nr:MULTISPECIES: DUF2586 family protein [Butyricimonas]MCB6971827.1 DUF2586 family protein [Butyricimonas synergistica]MCG4518835.1 DUF2586 family protein [Butyricimonas sp. DFI.6.44]
MPLPNVIITLGNGGLGQTSASDDGVAGLILTGKAVEGKLELNKHYQVSSTRDLISLGITEENNPLASKEIKAFYAQAGDGAELHLLIVSEATTLTQMCSPEASSPLCKLIDASGRRVRLLGVNKLPPEEYTPDVEQGIDADAISAATAAQQAAESYAAKIAPFRVLIPAGAWTGTTEKLYKPSEGSYNRVALVLASDAPTGETYTAAIGMILGRASRVEVHQSIGRVKNGALASTGYFTSGDDYLAKSGLAEALNDAGYIFFINLVSKNGCYLNGDPMAAPVTDDYSSLHLGRVIDKAMIIIYQTYIDEILDNIKVDDEGKMAIGACKNYEGMIDNAIAANMGDQVSSFTTYINPEQNILSTGKMDVSCKLVPLGVLREINVTLAFENPAL